MPEGLSVGSLFSGIPSEGSTLVSNGPGCELSGSASGTPTGGRCSPSGSPECPCTKTSALFVSENQRAEVLLTDYARQLTTGGGKPGQGYPMVLISSAEASRAKTCPSPDDEQGSTGNAPASSSSSPVSPSLFDPDGYSLRTYPDCSVATAVGTSDACLARWPTSGTVWPGGFSTHVSSECRSDEGGCSSSERSLSMILEPPLSVPDRYLLSARAARGILRRAEKRGRTLPEHLRAALLAAPMTPVSGEGNS